MKLRIRRLVCAIVGHDPGPANRITIEGQLLEWHDCGRCGSVV